MPNDRIGACVHNSSVRTGLNQAVNAVLEVERCPGEQSHSEIQHKQPNEASCVLRQRYRVRKENARGQGRQTCESCHYCRQRLGSETVTSHVPSPSSRQGSPAVLRIRTAFLHLHFCFLSALPQQWFRVRRGSLPCIGRSRAEGSGDGGRRGRGA